MRFPCIESIRLDSTGFRNKVSCFLIILASCAATLSCLMPAVDTGNGRLAGSARDYDEAGQLVLGGGSGVHANIYPGREIFNTVSPAYPDGRPYHEWRMYYSGVDTDAVTETVLEKEVQLWGTPRDRIYVASDYGQAAHDGSAWTKYGPVLEPSGSYDDPASVNLYPDGLHAGDVSPVIGPDNRMYLFYTGAYCPPGILPTSTSIVNTICVARADNDLATRDYVKSPLNPIIAPDRPEFDGNTFMPSVKYHDGRFKMWFLGAEELDGSQSATPISLWYTECATDPMDPANWTLPVQVFRNYWAPTTWWDRFPFYMDVHIVSDNCYIVYYTGFNYENYWQGIRLDHRQVGINYFFSTDGKTVTRGNDNGVPLLPGVFHQTNATYPDKFFMALAYVGDWGGYMYYGAYDHPWNSTKCRIYRYQVGYQTD